MAPDARQRIALVSSNVLLRESFFTAHLSDSLDADIVSFPSVDRLDEGDLARFCLVVFHAYGDKYGDEVAELSRKLRANGGAHFVVIADSEKADDVVKSFELGAKGYVPTSVSFDVVVSALRLVLVGGIYCPPCMLNSYDRRTMMEPSSLPMLTPKEKLVYQAVREGRSNKVIASQLGLSEGTIKVHVHRIMQKLKVHNRTQIAICQKHCENQQ